MTYVSWAIFVEGSTDHDYLAGLIPRCIEDIVFRSRGAAAEVPDAPAVVFGIGSRDFNTAAEEICKAKEAFELLFVHSDTGGRALEAAIEARTTALIANAQARCGLRMDRCIVVAPKKETEAWCLADTNALRKNFGVPNAFAFPMLPGNPAGVENLQDPKLTMDEVIDSLPSKRKGKFPFSGVAQCQEINNLMRAVPSFEAFYLSLASALGTFGYFPE